MNLLSEEQARARQLSLPRDGLLTGVSPAFVAELQLNGTFVEYYQQMIVNAGAASRLRFLCDRRSCQHFAPERQLGKVPLATLGPGQWCGERDVFLRPPSEEEAFAEGKVILWTNPARHTPGFVLCISCRGAIA